MHSANDSSINVPQSAACVQVIVEFVASWHSNDTSEHTPSLEDTSRLPRPGSHLSGRFPDHRDNIRSNQEDDGIKAVKVRVILHLEVFENIENVNQCVFSFQ